MVLTALAALVALLGPAPSQTSQEEILFDGLGSYTRAIQTGSPQAQRFFNQGMAFLYGFNHDEALRSFQAAARYDPQCPMVWWGLALANGPHINNPVVPPEREKAAVEAIQRAASLLDKATPLEKALIEAAGKRYADPQPADRSALDRAFADAMRQVWQQYPKDPDVGALFAEAMMDLRPWDLWKDDGSPQPGTEEVVATLEAVLKVAPTHPQANHLYIHAVEASPAPERALSAADRLRNLQPGLGHMVHMPSHIDVRTGRWREAIVANEKAIKADAAYRAKRPRQGFYRLYMSHNRHMLALAAMMRGESKRAIQAIDEMVAAIPATVIGDMAPVLDGFMAMPYEVRIRFGKWDDILALPELPETFPLARTLRHMARGVAYAAKGEPEKALKEQELFRQARGRVPEGATFGNNTAAAILAVAEPLLAGEVLIAERKLEAGIAQLRAAVAAEDRLRYDEPPDWINPARHPLGAALMEAGRYAEAEMVYRQDLRRLPNNGWSLYGLSQALARQDKTEEAESLSKQFARAWSDADLRIGSSCLCLPGQASAPTRASSSPRREEARLPRRAAARAG